MELELRADICLFVLFYFFFFGPDKLLIIAIK